MVKWQFTPNILAATKLEKPAAEWLWLKPETTDNNNNNNNTGGSGDGNNSNGAISVNTFGVAVLAAVAALMF
jgi:hypothetical protein